MDDKARPRIEVLVGSPNTTNQYKEIKPHREDGPLCLKVYAENGEGFYIEIYPTGTRKEKQPYLKVWGKVSPLPLNYVGFYYPQQELVLKKLEGKPT